MCIRDRYKDAGTYTVGFQAVRNGYKPSVGTAIVTINRRDVSLVSGGAEKPYDGTPLTNAEAGYTKDSLEFVKGEASFKAEMCIRDSYYCVMAVKAI